MTEFPLTGTLTSLREVALHTTSKLPTSSATNLQALLPNTLGSVPGLEPEPQGYAFPAQRRHHWAGDERAAGTRIEGMHSQ